jgi:hypothetical protein
MIYTRAVHCPAGGRILNTAYVYWARNIQRTQSMRVKISLWSKRLLCVRKNKFLPFNNFSVMGSTLTDNKLWYEIRDLFLGDNYHKQDIPLAIQMAKTCMHPDAQWLYGVFKNHADVCHDWQAANVLKDEMQYGNNDVQALCFYGYLKDPLYSEEITQAAARGYAFAQAVEASRGIGDNDCLELAQQSAQQGERDGFYCLARCYRSKLINIHQIVEYFKLAADLYDYNAMSEYANFLDDPKEAWKLWCKCYEVGCTDDFEDSVDDIVTNERFVRENDRPIIFMIGKVISKCRISGFNRHLRKSYVKAAKFYHAQLENYKAAVHAFSLCGLRLGLYKDVRILIGKTIWNGREEAAYL